jgi:hypothetical protein
MSNTPFAPASSRRGNSQTWVQFQWKNPAFPGQISAKINIMAWLASARLARLRHDGRHPASGKPADTQKNKTANSEKAPALIRWSIQEIRRIAQRLAQRRINPACIIAWSLWRRAYQAAAQIAHIKTKSQL